MSWSPPWSRTPPSPGPPRWSWSGGAASPSVWPWAQSLSASKVGSRYVQSRTAAGGWSQQRFARRREGQAAQLVRAAAQAWADLAPRRGPRCWSPAATGRCAPGAPGAGPARPARSRRARHLDVPDPRLAVLREAAERAQALARSTVREPWHASLLGWADGDPALRGVQRPTRRGQPSGRRARCRPGPTTRRCRRIAAAGGPLRDGVPVPRARRGALRRALFQPAGRGPVLRSRHDRHRGGATPSGTVPGASPCRRGGTGVGRDPRSGRTAGSHADQRPAPVEPSSATTLQPSCWPRWAGRRSTWTPCCRRASAYAGDSPPGPGRRDPAAARRAGLRLRGARGPHGRSGGRRSHLVWRESALTSSTPATRSRRAAWSRTRRPVQRPPRSVATCGTWAW